MNQTSELELEQLELLAEIDSLQGDLRRWTERLPEDWPPGRACRALIERLVQRADRLRLRLEAPLVVATLGGTGTGKSTLINAIVGEEVSTAGRQRPTTHQPTLICRPDLEPADLGIAPETVHVVRRDLPVLRDLVLLDCPDPDTTEDAEAAGTNLARLRHLMPHCDVLLVTATQQKYRSARVLDELASAAPGARLVFVQTHADAEDDIRDDWREVLAPDYEPGEIFFVDSLRALAEVRAGMRPSGDFGRLMDLLTRELAGSAGARIRRANFLDLAKQTLDTCRRRLDRAYEPVERLAEAIDQQRRRLATELARALRDELLRSRRQWEQRLLAEVADRWGFSPFAMVLRAYQGIGSLLAASILFRVRSPVQLALWGAVEGGRRVRRARLEQRARAAPWRAVSLGLDEGNLRASLIVLEGYANDAQLPIEHAALDPSDEQNAAMTEQFVSNVSRELQVLIGQLAQHHTRRAVRWTFELLWLALLLPIMLRMGKNFFWDSWLAPEPVPVYGLDFFVAAAFWLFAWATLLVWLLSLRMRRGLHEKIDELARRWSDNREAIGWFAPLDRQIARIERCRRELEHLEGKITDLKRHVARQQPAVGHRTTLDAAPPRVLLDEKP